MRFGLAEDADDALHGARGVCEQMETRCLSLLVYLKPTRLGGCSLTNKNHTAELNILHL